MGLNMGFQVYFDDKKTHFIMKNEVNDFQENLPDWLYMHYNGDCKPIAQRNIENSHRAIKQGLITIERIRNIGYIRSEEFLSYISAKLSAHNTEAEILSMTQFKSLIFISKRNQMSNFCLLKKLDYSDCFCQA